MTCRDVAGSLGSYLDGGLAPEMRASFDGHLALCPGCVAYVTTYRATMTLGREALRESDGASAPEGLVQAVLAMRRRGSD